MRRLTGRQDEKGVTLIEQVMAALFIGFLILVWVNSIRVTTKGTVQSKNNLRAQNLALSKLEDIKILANQYSYATNFVSVTQTGMVKTYRQGGSTAIEGKKFTWAVQTDFCVLPVSSTAMVVPPATTYTAVAVTWTTSNLWMQSGVFWTDVHGYKALTISGYATDFRQ